MEKETIDFLKQMFADMQEGITKINKDMNTGFKDVNERFEKVEMRLVKLETGQEQLIDKLEILSEVQQNHMNLNEKQHNEIVETLTGKLEITENVIRHITMVK